MTVAVYLADGYGIDFMASCSICKGLTLLVSCVWRELAEVDGLTCVSITLSSRLWVDVLWLHEDEMLRLERRPGTDVLAVLVGEVFSQWKIMSRLQD